MRSCVFLELCRARKPEKPKIVKTVSEYHDSSTYNIQRRCIICDFILIRKTERCELPERGEGPGGKRLHPNEDVLELFPGHRHRHLLRQEVPLQRFQLLLLVFLLLLLLFFALDTRLLKFEANDIISS